MLGLLFLNQCFKLTLKTTQSHIFGYLLQFLIEIIIISLMVLGYYSKEQEWWKQYNLYLQNTYSVPEPVLRMLRALSQANLSTTLRVVL